MTNEKVKISTIARLGALVVALINQVIAVFGGDALPFTENMAYQIVSLVLTIIVMGVNAWYNNDITHIAILAGKVFDALKDGKMTEEEIQLILEAVENSEADETELREHIAIKTANQVLRNLKNEKDE